MKIKTQELQGAALDWAVAKCVEDRTKYRAYNMARIAWELDRTALGDSYYGNALRVAKDIPGVTSEDRALLDRFATGANSGTDHVALQDLAARLKDDAQNSPDDSGSDDEAHRSTGG